MPGIIPEKCECSRQGTCRYCKMIAWGLKEGVVNVREIVGPRAVPVVKPIYFDADDAGSYGSEGRRNSARAKRKARLTRIRKDRERFQAKRAAARGLPPPPVEPERPRVPRAWTAHASPEVKAQAEATVDAVQALGMPLGDLRRRLVSYLKHNPEVLIAFASCVRRTTMATTATEDDYRNKAARRRR